MSSSQKVSWFRFVLLWFVISKWNFLQSALIDWPWAERFVFILRLTIMFVGICSASTVWGRHGAIFMSHPTTILNTCQQRKYYLKREKSLWCASACRDFCEFWKLCPLVRNGVHLHFFSPPLSADSVPPRTTHRSKTVLLFQRRSVSFGFSTFICRALCLY